MQLPQWPNAFCQISLKKKKKKGQLIMSNHVSQYLYCLLKYKAQQYILFSCNLLEERI